MCLQDLFQGKPARVQYGKRKNRDHIAGGIKENEDNFNFLVHHNYLGYDSSTDVTVNEYGIKKSYLDII